MRNEIEIYEKLMAIGRYSGCHQILDRSFCINGKQFPVCARCTGVFLGNITAYAIFLIHIPPVNLCLLGCTIMLVDWLVQYIDICESTNMRRLITGVVGGYSFTTLHLTVVKCIIQILFLNH